MVGANHKPSISILGALSEKISSQALSTRQDESGSDNVTNFPVGSSFHFTNTNG